jgi:hypothetical protein
MAWSILKMQSDALWRASRRTEEFFFSDWDLGLDAYDTPQQFDGTQAVLQGRVLIQEAIRRGPARGHAEGADGARQARGGGPAASLAALRAKMRPTRRRLREEGQDDLNGTCVHVSSLQLDGAPIARQPRGSRPVGAHHGLHLRPVHAKMARSRSARRTSHGDIFVKRL